MLLCATAHVAKARFEANRHTVCFHGYYPGWNSSHWSSTRVAQSRSQGQLNWAQGCTARSISIIDHAWALSRAGYCFEVFTLTCRSICMIIYFSDWWKIPVVSPSQGPGSLSFALLRRNFFFCSPRAASFAPVCSAWAAAATFRFLISSFRKR